MTRPGLNVATADKGHDLRLLFDSDDLRVGTEIMEPWSSMWDADLETGTDASLSFPHQTYRVFTEAQGLDCASPNQVLFDNPQCAYRRPASTRQRLRNDWMAFDAATMVSSIERYDPGVRTRPDGPFARIDACVDARTHAVQRLLIRYLELEPRADRVLVREMGSWVLRRVLRAAYDTERCPVVVRADTRARHRRTTRRAREHIATNLSAALSIGDLGRVAGVAPTHLCEIFRQQTGSTVHDYVTEARVKRALELLPGYRGRLLDLAFDLGFSSAGHLGDVFRRRYGTPPSRMAHLVEHAPATAMRTIADDQPAD